MIISFGLAMPITSLKQLKEIFNDGRGKTAIRPILNYYPNGIQSAFIDIDHDGCDSFGWESDLVTITIKAKINGQMRRHEWYYEDWFGEKLPTAQLLKDTAI